MDFKTNNMKKIIALALIIGTTTFIQAQSNLVFNQVLNFNIGLGEAVTVPDGKAWKLESGISQGNFVITSTNQEYGNNLDSSNMPANALQTLTKPLWLGQGTSLTLFNAATDDNYLSILEFNVVPTSSSVTSNSGFTGVSSHIDTYYFNEEFIISNAEAGDFKDLNSITVPEGQIWKVIYAFRTRFGAGNDYPNAISEDAVIIDEMLFKDERRNEFWLDSGEHSVKFFATSASDKNKIVIKALIYDIN